MIAELNPQQQAAARHKDGVPALVIAGAGSGKTRTLTARVEHLLSTGVPPWRILLLTFTNKAAREMLARVSASAGSAAEGIWGGTFHSVCNRILRANARMVGLEPNFTILDAEEARKAAARSAKALVPSNTFFPKPALLSDIFSTAAALGESVESIVTGRFPAFIPVSGLVADVHRHYMRAKLAASCVDFDDLLSLVSVLFRKHPDILHRYRTKFLHVLVDEFQDTNTLQYSLVESLSAEHGNLFVVGDDAQSIYAWRGARYANIIEFPDRHPSAVVYKIETNYRSTPEILALANATIANNTSGFSKTLRPARSAGQGVPVIVPAPHPRDAAAFVAQRIIEIESDGIPLQDIAILYRAHFHVMDLQLELTSRNIPFTVTSGLKFFETSHIKDVAAFLRLATNPTDLSAFLRILSLLPGIAEAGALKIWHALGDRFSVDKLFSAKVRSGSLKALRSLALTLEAISKPGMTPADMIAVILEGVYPSLLKSAHPNADARLEDISTLQGYAAAFSDPSEFLTQLALLSGVDATPADAPENGVTLSTVHQAKGLEWPVVFVIGLSESLFPTAKAIDAEEFDADSSAIEEERRLFYVSCTRAMSQLYLVYPKTQTQKGRGTTVLRPSRFLKEIPRNLYELWSLE